MKVAIDSGPLTDGDSIRGKGVYVRELTKKLRGVEACDFVAKWKDLFEGGYDVLHFTRFHPFFISLPFSKPKRTKFVLTIYDLIPLIYPKHYPPGIRGFIRWQINKFLIRKNVDAIITISETSKKDICRFIGVDPGKVHVTRLAPVPAYKKIADVSEAHLPKKFVFNYGDINYNKNIPTLVAACDILKIPLVIAGRQAKELESMDLTHAEHKHLKPIYEELTDETKVIRPGYISDEEANVVYNLASVYVQPSCYEGFGLSVINAFAAGCPVVAAKTQALVEIGEGACLFVDPNDAKDMAKKIESIMKDEKLREKLIKAGSEIAERRSWERVADETVKVYSSIT